MRLISVDDILTQKLSIEGMPFYEYSNDEESQSRFDAFFVKNHHLDFCKAHSITELKDGSVLHRIFTWPKGNTGAITVDRYFYE